MRDRRAVHAWLRGGAGPMKDRRAPRGGERAAARRETQVLAADADKPDMTTEDPMTQNASDRYDHHRVETEAKLIALRAKLDAMDAAQKTDPGSWGWPGTAAHVNELLGEITDFLGS